MIGEKSIVNFSDFKEKSRQNLAVAEWCYENGHYDACCNRAYYAMYHAAIAALANEGITPSQKQIDHGWVQSRFVIHFCKRHKIFPKLKTYLQDAQRIRDTADYHAEPLNRKKARLQMNWAKEFVQTCLGMVEANDEF